MTLELFIICWLLCGGLSAIMLARDIGYISLWAALLLTIMGALSALVAMITCEKTILNPVIWRRKK